MNNAYHWYVILLVASRSTASSCTIGKYLAFCNFEAKSEPPHSTAPLAMSFFHHKKKSPSPKSSSSSSSNHHSFFHRKSAADKAAKKASVEAQSEAVRKKQEDESDKDSARAAAEHKAWVRKIRDIYEENEPGRLHDHPDFLSVMLEPYKGHEQDLYDQLRELYSLDDESAASSNGHSVAAPASASVAAGIKSASAEIELIRSGKVEVRDCDSMLHHGWHLRYLDLTSVDVCLHETETKREKAAARKKSWLLRKLARRHPDTHFPLTNLVCGRGSDDDAHERHVFWVEVKQSPKKTKKVSVRVHSSREADKWVEDINAAKAKDWRRHVDEAHWRRKKSLANGTNSDSEQQRGKEKVQAQAPELKREGKNAQQLEAMQARLSTAVEGKEMRERERMEKERQQQEEDEQQVELQLYKEAAAEAAQAAEAALEAKLAKAAVLAKAETLAAKQKEREMKAMTGKGSLENLSMNLMLGRVGKSEVKHEVVPEDGVAARARTQAAEHRNRHESHARAEAHAQAGFAPHPPPADMDYTAAVLQQDGYDEGAPMEEEPVKDDGVPMEEKPVEDSKADEHASERIFEPSHALHRALRRKATKQIQATFRRRQSWKKMVASRSVAAVGSIFDTGEPPKQHQEDDEEVKKQQPSSPSPPPSPPPPPPPPPPPLQAPPVKMPIELKLRVRDLTKHLHQLQSAHEGISRQARDNGTGTPASRQYRTHHTYQQPPPQQQQQQQWRRRQRREPGQPLSPQEQSLSLFGQRQWLPQQKRKYDIDAVSSPRPPPLPMTTPTPATPTSTSPRGFATQPRATSPSQTTTLPAVCTDEVPYHMFGRYDYRKHLHLEDLHLAQLPKRRPVRSPPPPPSRQDNEWEEDDHVMSGNAEHTLHDSYSNSDDSAAFLGDMAGSVMGHSPPCTPPHSKRKHRLDPTAVRKKALLALMQREVRTDKAAEGKRRLNELEDQHAELLRRLVCCITPEQRRKIEAHTSVFTDGRAGRALAQDIMDMRYKRGNSGGVRRRGHSVGHGHGHGRAPGGRMSPVAAVNKYRYIPPTRGKLVN